MNVLELLLVKEVITDTLTPSVSNRWKMMPGDKNHLYCKKAHVIKEIAPDLGIILTYSNEVMYVSSKGSLSITKDILGKLELTFNNTTMTLEVNEDSLDVICGIVLDLIFRVVKHLTPENESNYPNHPYLNMR